jgi:hypothetical protein
MMSLKDWQLNGWLIAHKTSPQEIADLLAVADRDLNDCKASGLSADWRLNIAYNAALQAATAALAACGYRAVREAHHYRVIQSLVYTIDLSPSVVTQFDAFRKKRNIGGYERAGMTSDQEADEMFSLAKNIREKVENWLHRNYPELLAGG